MIFFDLKNDPQFFLAIKIGTFTGILVAVAGVAREIWIVLQVNQTRSRLASDAISQGLEARVLVWPVIGILVEIILFRVSISYYFADRGYLRHGERS
jgi:hypothetical protein